MVCVCVCVHGVCVCVCVYYDGVCVCVCVCIMYIYLHNTYVHREQICTRVSINVYVEHLEDMRKLGAEHVRQAQSMQQHFITVQTSGTLIIVGLFSPLY
jgi:hypothetical protein